MKKCVNCGYQNEFYDERCERCGCEIDKKAEKLDKTYSYKCRRCGNVISIKQDKVCPYCGNDPGFSKMNNTLALMGMNLMFPRGR